MYDIIGDVHGQASKLEELLALMGYRAVRGSYKAPAGRQAIFLGDLIDRGPGQLRTLEIVRSMVEAGDARCIAGNHEFNAIGYATEDPGNPGEYLRPNRADTPKCRKNRAQHEAFLSQVATSATAHKDWVDWFKTLPPALDLGGIRVAHACWDQDAVTTLADAGWHDGQPLSDEVLIAAYQRGSPIQAARELLTCGLEIGLPTGHVIRDKAGHEHNNVRVANWRNWATSFHEIALVPAGQESQLEGMDWPAGLVISAIEGAPVFVGHHWFNGHPVVESPKLACLDWSAAQGGPLVAYRWSGETELSSDRLVWAS